MDTLLISLFKTASGLEVLNRHKDQLVASMRAAIDKPPFKEHDNIKGAYCNEVVESIMLVDKSLERLHQSFLHYSTSKIPEYFNLLDLENEDFFTYHLENFYIRYSSVSDLMAHLINKALKLGYQERFCNLHKILDNTTIDKGLKRELGMLINMMNTVKKVRNKIIHNGIDIGDQVSHKLPGFLEVGIESTGEIEGIEIDPSVANYVKEKRKKETHEQHEHLTEHHEALWNQCDAVIKSLSAPIALQLRIIQIKQELE